LAPRFPNAWVDQVYAASSIVDVVSNYLPLNKKGHRHWGLCPFHNEKTPSFSVNPELNLYYCFGCKASGNIAQFVMEMEKLSYPEALLYLAKTFRLPPPPVMEEDPEEERRRSLRERLIDATRDAAQYYHDQLWTPEGSAALQYLYGRGLDDTIIRRFGIGASPDDWDGLLIHLTAKGYSAEELQQAALVTAKDSNRYDTFRDRVMFPIINRYGQPIGFGARALGSAQPKYLNTSDSPIFNKRSNVYGINLLKRQRSIEQLILVEGYLDVVALSQNGINNVVATLGTSLTTEQARLMKSYAPEVVIAYDGDEPGQMAALRALDLLYQEGIAARVMRFPGGLDPDEFIRSEGVEAFHALRPMPAMAFRLLRLEGQMDLSREETKQEYAKQSCQMLHMLKEPVEIDYYLGKIQLKTGIAKEVLAAQLRIGRGGQTEVLPPETARPRTAQSGKPAFNQPEFTLAALLAGKYLPRDFILEDDFEDPAIRRIVSALLKGTSPAVIMEEAEEEKNRLIAGELFNKLPDLDRENALTAAEDCLRTMRSNKLNHRIQQLSEEVKTLEGEQKSLMLQLISELQAELNRTLRQMTR
jgi:DNA primase